MPVVLVHGVPDTAAMWDPVVAALTARGIAEADVVRLALPGFDAPLPDGFGCTKEEYADWIVQRIVEIGSPVDLVGHDWGAMFTEYIGSGRPEIIRSWAAFNAAIDADYVWHDLAQLWQTPEVGEQIMEAMTGDALVATLRENAHPDPEGTASRVDDAMKTAILALYRSAVTVGAEWQPTVEGNERPALIGWGEQDPFTSVETGEAFAARVQGTFALIEGARHWSAIERPEQVAEILTTFWSSRP